MFMALTNRWLIIRRCLAGIARAVTNFLHLLEIQSKVFCLLRSIRAWPADPDDAREASPTPVCGASGGSRHDRRRSGPAAPGPVRAAQVACSADNRAGR